MRTQAASAVSVPNPARTAAVLAPHILPAISAPQNEAVAPDRGIRKSKKRRSPSVKKAAQHGGPVPKRKTAERRAVKVKKATSPAATKAMQPPSAANSLPQLVRIEKPTASTREAEAALPEDAQLANPTSPLLVLTQDNHDTIATLAGNEISPDGSDDLQPCLTAQIGAPADFFSTAPLERPGFLEALSLQAANLLRILTQSWSWIQQKLKSHQGRKRLRVCETVSLGEKRFVAVIQVDGKQFLVGGSSSSVSTLAHLEPRLDFPDVFRTQCEQGVDPA
ncbi:MAG: flagellar biosynthetic protein FliO [Terriglobales bacterium]